MLRHMRTTVRLDDRLFAQIKRYAQDSGQTFTTILQDALRGVLSRRVVRPKSRRVKLITFSGKGLLPGVDLDDTSALLDLMEGKKK